MAENRLELIEIIVGLRQAIEGWEKEERGWREANAELREQLRRRDKALAKAEWICEQIATGIMIPMDDLKQTMDELAVIRQARAE